jgi:hypothetical protein
MYFLKTNITVLKKRTLTNQYHPELFAVSQLKSILKISKQEENYCMITLLLLVWATVGVD